MSTKLLEKKLAEIRKRVAAKPRPVAKPTWRDAIGTFAGDELDREAARLGAEWRARENKRR